MGREQAVPGGEQGTVGGGGLLGQHVQAGPCQAALVQGVGQGLLADKAAPGGVDQKGGGLHQPQAAGVHQALGLGGEGAVEGDHVAFPEQGVQVHPAAGGGLLFGAAGEEHLHAQGLAQPGHGFPDVPEAHDAQLLAPQFRQGPGPRGFGLRLGPLPPAHRLGVALPVACQAQQQGQGVLGHGLHAVVGHVAQGDAPLPGGGAVHLVDADGQRADVPQLRQGVHSLPVQPHPVGDQGPGAPGPLQEQLPGRIRVHGQVPQGLQGGPGDVPRVGGASVEHDDLHKIRLLSRRVRAAFLPVYSQRRPAARAGGKAAEKG